MKNKTKTNTAHANSNTKKIVNWSKYSKNLEARGNFCVLLNIAVLNSTPTQTGKAGHPFYFSNAVILFLAQLREFTQLPLRQTIGLAMCILKLGGVELDMPSYITLARRLSRLNIPTHLPSSFSSPIIFLPDSTGEKITGEGEWFRHKHGKNKRRGWVKVHVGIDYASQYILSTITTPEYVGDGNKLIPLVDKAKQNVSRLEIGDIIADGAYGSQALHKEAKQRHINLLVPPPKNALWHGDIKSGKLVDSPGWELRNQYIRGCMRLGRKQWKQQIGYHKRSLAETAMWRLKSAFGAKLKSRTERNQRAEIDVRTSLLNLWTSYGLPEYAGEVTPTR